MFLPAAFVVTSNGILGLCRCRYCSILVLLASTAIGVSWIRRVACRRTVRSLAKHAHVVESWKDKLIGLAVTGLYTLYFGMSQCMTLCGRVASCGGGHQLDSRMRDSRHGHSERPPVAGSV